MSYKKVLVSLPFVLKEGNLFLVDSSGFLLFGEGDKYDHDVDSDSGGLYIARLEGWMQEFEKFISFFNSEDQEDLNSCFSYLKILFKDYEKTHLNEVSSDMRYVFAHIYVIIRENLSLFKE